MGCGIWRWLRRCVHRMPQDDGMCHSSCPTCGWMKKDWHVSDFVMFWLNFDNFLYFLMQRYLGFRNAKKDWHVSVLVIENEFDNFDNYNLNLLLFKRIILRSRKTGFPTCSLDEFDPFPEDWKNSQDRQESGTCPLILWIQQALSAEFAIHWMSDRTCESFLSVFQRSLVDLGVDVVTTASTSWVCASDPVTRYLSHNVPSHPTEVLRC